MTVANTAVQQLYTCNGVTTTFVIPFQWFDLTQIKVYKVTIATGALTLLTVNTDYIYNDPTTPTTVQTVDAMGDPTAYSSAYKVLIARNTPRTQIIDYINNGSFKAEDHERGMDRIVMEVQEAADEADRSIKLSPVDGLDLTLPPIQASSVIAVNSTGDGLEYKDQADFVGATGPAGANGQGVPTGGTTGQVLAKRSGTDFDSVWEDLPPALPTGGTVGQLLAKQSSTDGDAIWEDPPAVSPTTTKGDIIVRNATVDQRLAVGNDGEVLTADSTQLSGLKYKSIPSRVADMDYPNSSPQDIVLASGIGVGNYAEQVIFIRASTSDVTEQPITATTPFSQVRPAGSKMTLIGATSPNNDQILLLDSATHCLMRGPFIFTPGAAIEFISDGIDWYEKSRSS